MVDLVTPKDWEDSARRLALAAASLTDYHYAGLLKGILARDAAIRADQARRDAEIAEYFRINGVLAIVGPKIAAEIERQAKEKADADKG